MTISSGRERQSMAEETMTIKHEDTSGGDYVRYIADTGEIDPLATTLNWFTMPKSDLVAAAFVARDWHSGQFSALYRLSCADFSFETLQGAESELIQAVQRANVSPEEQSEAQSALETLQQVTSYFAHVRD